MRRTTDIPKIPAPGARLWMATAGVWMLVAVMVATQTHLYRAAIGDPFTWFDSFRYPVVECAFWAFITPLALAGAMRWSLFANHRVRNLPILLGANVAVEALHAVYRTRLHGFVYPFMGPIPPRTLLRFYLAGNLLNDVWIFWSIVGVAHLAMSYLSYLARDKELARAQLQLLRSQVRPHFLFNALNSVSSLMRDDVEAADDMIAKLSCLLRTSLKAEPDHEVTLREELEIVRAYLEIEQIRFQDRLRFSLEVQPEALASRVPALLLLPFVENAVRHGVAMSCAAGEIRIAAARETDEVALEIRNSGPPRETGTVREGIGLGGARTRLETLYSGRFQFTYRLLETGGMIVNMRIPYTTDAHSNHHRR